VGDVAGHGVPAVAEMIELRSAIHALLRANQPIDRIFTVADEILGAAEQTRIATATVAVFDAHAACVRYASAGHPPPLLRARDGSVEVLLDGRRPVLGVPSTEGYVVAERPFERGATFVAYTDGLIERRHEDLLDSINRLAELLRGTDLDGEPLADAILGARGDVEATTDDVALVVARAT
jgi:serine phosphatase RsbU (regulator of sigma subunit)